MDVIGDKIKAGDRVTCTSADSALRLQEKRTYTVRSTFMDRGQLWLTLAEMPSANWEAIRFKRTPVPYGWYNGP